jgi:hypothetical protein
MWAPNYICNYGQWMYLLLFEYCMALPQWIRIRYYRTDLVTEFATLLI